MEAALAELQDGGVILRERGAEGAYRFHHALVHDVIYDSLLEVDRRHLHGEVGARLEAQYAGHEAEVAEDLARHFEAAGETRAAARYAYVAGTKALDLFALRDAETWYGKCLSLASSERGTEDDLLFARAVVNQTQVLCWNGDFPAMVALAQRHLPRIQALGAVKEASLALTWIGEGYMHVGRYEDARATLGQALESGRALEDESSIGYASGELMWLDTIVGEGDQFDSLPNRITELEALAGRVSDRYLTTLAHYIRWAHATQTGRMGVALETARHLRAHGEQSSYPPAVCWGACLEADGHAKAGNAVEAERAARAGLEVAASRFDLLMAELSLGMTLVTIGRTEDGLALLKKAPWRTDRIGALYFAYAGDVAFGRALAAAGQVKEGLDWLRGGIEWFERIGNRRAACMTTLELARILIEDTDHNGPREGFRLRLRTLFAGATSLIDEARACLDRVLAARQTLSMHGASAEALMLRARLAERDKDFAASRDALAEAHALAASLEWLPLEQRINAEIRRLGAQGDP
jgi:tetratricopeptide (TPR) repeat protein